MHTAESFHFHRFARRQENLPIKKKRYQRFFNVNNDDTHTHTICYLIDKTVEIFYYAHYYKHFHLKVNKLLFAYINIICKSFHMLKKGAF